MLDQWLSNYISETGGQEQAGSHEGLDRLASAQAAWFPCALHNGLSQLGNSKLITNEHLSPLAFLALTYTVSSIPS